MQTKALVFERRPFSKVHSILTSQGFTLIGIDQSVKYRVPLRDTSTESTYWLEIPVDQNAGEPNQAKLGKPSLYGEKRIPRPVREAAESKLYEIADYLRNIIVKKVVHLPNHKQLNNSMVPNVDEMMRLGKEMESMQTNAELEASGWIPDPIQYEPKS
ncbi:MULTISPECIES: hypothetical protein [Neobacillus]|uniref:Uncharacterized protein n=1 Tax=Neobacillus rhizosphaerae TaxID=2880965 RepID=A0ABN8KPB4_9BACI|nr:MULTISPECIES: hypothetical protein [Neobacillus]CAH2714080.1 hypothetical protein BACCIP111895_01234 [Neobacillus rhizosphaerae]